jgi:putative two-component system response regulator
MENKPKQHILIVDNEEQMRSMIARLLSREGYECSQAETVEAAWTMLQRTTYPLMVLNIRMPGASGIELLEKAHADQPDLAVIMLTPVDDQAIAMRALELGACGYVITPFETNELLISVANALERRYLAITSRRYERELELKVSERTAEVRATQEEITRRLVAVSEWRDDESVGHSKRIGIIAARIAVELGWRGQPLEDLRLAAPMHDIGKVGLPDTVLRKPNKLTAEEFEIVKTHTTVGAEILAGARAPLLRMAREIALCHHEKWDGSGYPRNVAGAAIPLTARIVAVADVYDAMTHPRVYRPAIPEEHVLTTMRANSGRHFDPAVVGVFLEIVPQLRIIRQEMDDAQAHGSGALAGLHCV